jgi:hypothetical protein
MLALVVVVVALALLVPGPTGEHGSAARVAAGSAKEMVLGSRVGKRAAATARNSFNLTGRDMQKAARRSMSSNERLAHSNRLARVQGWCL